jgi:Leucine-rich repeat (LRR) protein
MTWLFTLVTASINDSCMERVISGFTLNLTANSLNELPTYMNEATSRLIACHNKISILANGSFSSTRNLQFVILRYNEIHTLEAGTFSSLHNLQEVDLGYNRIEYIDKYLFRHNSLFKLNLEHNSIGSLNLDIIKYARDIWKFVIRQNKIQKLQAGIFLNAYELSEVDVSRNEISEFDHDIFQNNEELIKLDLSSNRISKLHPHIFKSASLLKRLNISHNEILSLEVNLFSSNTYLHTLDLSNNAVDYLEEKIFVNVTRLEILNMSNNKLNSINKDIFSNNVGITEIDISCNFIVYIHPSTFKRNEKLTVLNMRRNRLVNISGQIFSNNTKLKTVDLSGNKISAIDPKTFATTEEIQHLNLSNNLIKELVPGMFDSNRNLINVDLSHNMITSIDNKMFALNPIQILSLRGNKLAISAEDTPLLIASSLEKLDLGSCGITTLQRKTFQRMSKLKELVLDNNHLQFPVQSDPENNVFSELRKLLKLELSVNNITTIKCSLLYGMGHLKFLNLSFNPAVCNDCRDEEIWIWCTTKNVRCIAKCNFAERPSVIVSPLNCTKTASENECTFLNDTYIRVRKIQHHRGKFQVYDKKEEPEENKFNLGTEQSDSITIYPYVGLCVAIVLVIFFVAAFILIRARRRRREKSRIYL